MKRNLRLIVLAVAFVLLSSYAFAAASGESTGEAGKPAAEEVVSLALPQTWASVQHQDLGLGVGLGVGQVFGLGYRDAYSQS